MTNGIDDWLSPASNCIQASTRHHQWVVLGKSKLILIATQGNEISKVGLTHVDQQTSKHTRVCAYVHRRTLASGGVKQTLACDE